MSSRAVAVHDESCPDIGPICAVRAEPPQRHHTTLLATDVRLFAEYGLAPGTALQVELPVRIIGTKTRYTDLLDNPITLDYQNIHHRDETLVGLGDAQLLLHQGFKAGGVAVSGRAGLSLPFGVVHDDPYKLTAEGLSHEHLQLGTGTVDPVLSVDAAVPVGGFSFAAFGGLQAPLYQGPRGYRAGVRSQGGLVASKAVDSVTLRLSAQALHEQPERWQGRVPTDDGNQGRTDLFVSPGVTWNFSGEWMLNADLRIRAYSHVQNAQLDMPVVLELGIGRLFHLEQGFAETSVQARAGDVLDAVRAGEEVALLPVPGKWTVFDFWATWCEACKTLDVHLRELAAQRPSLAVRRVNIVDFDSPIARRELAGVLQLPHIRIVGPGGEVVFEGSGPADELLREIERLVR